MVKRCLCAGYVQIDRLGQSVRWKSEATCSMKGLVHGVKIKFKTEPSEHLM